ncbi:MAG TPA: hypothetical protein VF226_19895 [Hyphomicrobiaceae bacterium]|jgi:hypothetical protein
MNDYGHAHPLNRMETAGRVNGRVGALLIIAAMLLINAVVLAAWWAGHSVVLSKEHSLLEETQLIILIPAFVLFWLGWRYGHDAEKTASGALAMLVAAAFVRELDVKTLGGPDWFRWLSHHGLQEILLVAMTLPILWYLARRRHHWWGLIRLALAPAAIPLYIAGILLVVAVEFDRDIAVNAELRFWEEFFELNGYLLLVLTGWNHWSIVRNHMAPAA